MILEINDEQVVVIGTSLELFLESVEASELVLTQILSGPCDKLTTDSVKEELAVVDKLKETIKPILEKIKGESGKPEEKQFEDLPGKPKWV